MPSAIARSALLAALGILALPGAVRAERAPAPPGPGGGAGGLEEILWKDLGEETADQGTRPAAGSGATRTGRIAAPGTPRGDDIDRGPPDAEPSAEIGAQAGSLREPGSPDHDPGRADGVPPDTGAVSGTGATARPGLPHPGGWPPGPATGAGGWRR